MRRPLSQVVPKQRNRSNVSFALRIAGLQGYLLLNFADTLAKPANSSVPVSASSPAHFTSDKFCKCEFHYLIIRRESRFRGQPVQNRKT